MTNLEVDFQFPKKLIKPLFYTDKKHRLFKGGRAGGKSESIARALIILSMQTKGNILCVRSFQVAIKKSNYSLIKRVIEESNLLCMFEFYVDGIVCKANGNRFMFLGCNSLSNPKSEMAKGLDDVKYCWCEEAHTFRDMDIEILIPSVRAEDCVFFWSYNSNSEPCPVSMYFSRHSKAEFTTIDYDENPFLPKSMIEEAEELKKMDYEQYLKVWRGKPYVDLTSRLIDPAWLTSAVELWKGEDDGQLVYGLDVADEGGAENALCRRRGHSITDLWSWEEGDTYETARKSLGLMEKGGHLIYDRVGVGAGVKSSLRVLDPNFPTTAYSNGNAVLNPTREYKRTGIKNKDMFSNLGSQQWFILRDMLQASHARVLGREHEGDYLTVNPKLKGLSELVKELAQIEFSTNSKGQIAVDKKPKGCPSPNKADSVMMTLMKPKVLASPIF